ncbi:MAG TPA: phosphotransferase [Leptolyngbyaceae cyanobacterium M33_DOE_097]|uniref:Aminoglycoside phosphotransferase domain-containing protein n=1 Tax=Oscillatoriales cyanobacterium SpSt-418 TaxID=2282169 RepID=A0A7C3PGN0_9CYAN|nr:phosphotransferase [Leptolyngbyaceae cyanobacterium M33_DOE_097]
MLNLFKLKVWGVAPEFRPELMALDLCDFDKLMLSPSLGRPFKTKPSLELYRLYSTEKKVYFLKRSLPRKSSVVLRDMLRWVRRGKPAHTEAFHVYEAAQTLKELGIPAMKVVAWGEERWFTLWPHQGFVLAEGVEGEEAIEVFEKGTKAQRLALLKDVGHFLGRLHSMGLFVENRLIDLIYNAPTSKNCLERRPRLTLIDLDFKGITLKKKEYNATEAAKYLGRSYYLSLRCGHLIDRADLHALMRGYRDELRSHGIQVPPAFHRAILQHVRINLKSHFKDAELIKMFPSAPDEISDDGRLVFKFNTSERLRQLSLQGH